MFKYILFYFEANKKAVSSKVVHTTLFQDKFKYFKTTHAYHLVDPSPWPLVASLGAFMFTLGGVLYMHKFMGGWNLLITGFSIILYVMFTWWRDIIREATFEDTHTITVQKGLRLGMILFIVQKLCSFLLFFGHFSIRVWHLSIILEEFGRLKLLVQLTPILSH
jgi:cytochrome c oxidase subunit 3